MAYQKLKVEHNLPVIAATDIAPKQFLTPGGTSVLLAIPCGSQNVRPHWHSDLGTTASGMAVPCQESDQIVKAVACASLGCGAEVSIGSTNGRLAPLALVAASAHWSVGIAVSPAADGETFSVDFRPRKV